MSIYEFALLDEIAKLEVFWDGIFVGEKRDGEFIMMCRRVADFYVEYKILGGHYIDLKILTNLNQLALYMM